MRREIFSPLHMEGAGFGAPGTPGETDEPWGHLPSAVSSGTPTPMQVDNAPVMGPAGTLHCPIGDWAKFVAEILREARGGSGLVSAETFKKLITPRSGQQYAGGWILLSRPWAGGLALMHTGSNSTWYCDVWIAPAKNFAVLFATNEGGDAAGEAADEGVGLLIGLNANSAGTR
jgi:CubicO group peptidase (beta-lactamase class C family)